MEKFYFIFGQNLHDLKMLNVVNISSKSECIVF